jgi:O-methyltransferase
VSATGRQSPPLGMLRRFRELPGAGRIALLWEFLTLPATAYFLLSNPLIDRTYGLSWRKQLTLAFRMWRTTSRVTTTTSYKAHLAMAAKLFQVPREVKGVVVECGCFRGGSTANLSLACDLAGRELVVYDSFEGLPPPKGNDKYAKASQTGGLSAGLDLVKRNVARYGVVERCEFRKGWFHETLPKHTERIVLAFLDVDYQSSLDECVRNLWPRLIQRGYLFTDEYVLTDYCALFWSERYWRENFDSTPPGLIGSGSGVGVGQYYLGPWAEMVCGPPVAQSPTSIAYTRKDFSGYWDYDPDATPAESD